MIRCVVRRWMCVLACAVTWGFGYYVIPWAKTVTHANWSRHNDPNSHFMCFKTAQFCIVCIDGHNLLLNECSVTGLKQKPNSEWMLQLRRLCFSSGWLRSCVWISCGAGVCLCVKHCIRKILFVAALRVSPSASFLFASFIELRSKIKFLESAETEVSAKRVEDVYMALVWD